MAYSKELRREVLAACDARVGTRVVALRFKVSESWVRRVKQERREQRKLGPCTKRRRTPKWAAEAERIQAVIARQPDLTLAELQTELSTELSRMTLCRALRQLRLTLKKSPEGDGAATTGRRGSSCAAASSPGRLRSGEVGIYRRDVGQNEHDPTPRSISLRHATGLRRALRSLEDDDVLGGLANQGPDRSVGRRRSDQRRPVPRLRRAASRADARRGRRRCDGQPQLAQSCRRASGNRTRRGRGALLAAVQSRLQPDRKCLLETQGALARQSRANHQSPVGCARYRSRTVLTCRMCQLLQGRWI